MTLIMLWKEPHTERLWLVSDSLLSDPGPNGGQMRFTDHAAKITQSAIAVSP